MINGKLRVSSYLVAVILFFGEVPQAAMISGDKDFQNLNVVSSNVKTGEKVKQTFFRPYKEGEVIVVLKENVSSAVISSDLASNRIQIVKMFQHISAMKKRTYVLLKGNKSTEEIIDELKQDSRIKSVSPNYRRTIMATTPDDSDFSQLWGLNNTGQSVNEITGTVDADIDAPEAWDTSTGSQDVVVAVFDTGVDYTHEDLSANMWVNSKEASGISGVDDDQNGYVDDIYGYDMASTEDGDNDSDPMDILGHGTHVSGTIGAKGNNDTGITGVNWDVKIMALKVFRPDLGAYDSDILEAIEYVLTMKNDYNVNIVAVNASYGGEGGSAGDDMDEAIQSLGDADIVFVAAAGNEENDNDRNPSYPASYTASNIIAVAATDQNDSLASFSNYGATSVDLAAPGTNIRSTFPGGPVDGDIFLDDVENGAGNWVASGTWAIVSEDNSQVWTDSPDGDYENNTDASLSYGSDIDLSGYTDQDIGIGACIKYDLEAGYDNLYLELSGDSGNSWTTLYSGSITGSSNDNWICKGVMVPKELRTANFRMRYRLNTDGSVTADGVYIDKIVIGTLHAADSYVNWDGTSMATPHVTGAVALMAAAYQDETVSERIDRILRGVDILSSLDDKVATGGRLNIATSILLVPNHAPIAQNDSATVEEDGSVAIDVLSNDSDEDNDTLSIARVSTPAHGIASINGIKIDYAPDVNYNGTDSFTYTVSDGKGGTATATVSVTITAINDDPVANNDSVTVEVDQSVAISVLANDTDVDNDSLSISSVITAPEHGIATINGTQIVYTPEVDYIGSDSFAYEISDGNGGFAVATVNVTVIEPSSGDDSSEDVSSGGGGGCAYNPHTKSVDLMVLLMMLISFLYPVRRKLFR